MKACSKQHWKIVDECLHAYSDFAGNEDRCKEQQSLGSGELSSKIQSDNEYTNVTDSSSFVGSQCELVKNRSILRAYNAFAI